MHNNRSQATAQGQQLSLAIQYAPPIVRRHGLRESHSFPLVSHGKGEDGEFTGSFRVPAPQGWKYPSIELRSAMAWPAIVLDVDQPDALHELLWQSEMDGSLARPNWIVQRTPRGGCHAVWTLARPVLRGPDARERPRRMYGRVTEYFAQKCGADRGYSGVLTHNPSGRARGRRGLKTHWLREPPYELRELGFFIPKGWRVPPKPITTVGRNCAVFNELMRFAGQEQNIDVDLEAYALDVLRLRYVDPNGVQLPDNEVRGIARSVGRYRVRWIAQGRYGVDPEQQAWRGRRSGEARRAKTADRDKGIVWLHLEGLTQAQIAQDAGVHQTTVSRILNRDHSPCDCIPFYADYLTPESQYARTNTGDVLPVGKS